MNTSFLKTACISFTAALLLSACGGGGDSAPAIVPPTGGGPSTPSPVAAKPYTNLETRAEASRFLMQAGFGGTEAEIDAWVGRDAADWVVAEMRKAPTLTLQQMLSDYAVREDTDREHTKIIWENLLTADDQLRQRMFFALSQVFVISDNSFFDKGFAQAYYTDLLTENAFGTYRNLIEDITYSPAMSDYLTYYRNRKGDEATGRMPDENYAREILQLFSIGLVELNLDGTPKAGSPETYDNDDIIGLARVFTGFSGEGPDFNYNSQVDGYGYRPLKIFADQHSELEKSFLDVTIPANTDGTTSVTTALDTIAAHPNVAPFLSRQLIQRFTASSPSPDYVERVATVFNSGRYTAPNGQAFGQGERGDLQAVIAAILLDESVHDDEQADNEGKLREPVLKFVQYHRAFQSRNIDVPGESRLNDTRDPNEKLAQHPLRSNSVFNFYRPGYVAPNTESGDANLTAPELQIVNEAASLGFANFMTHYIFRVPNDPTTYPRFQPNFTTEANLADTPQALVDHLDIKLTAGQMSDATKAEIVDVVSTLELDPEDLEDTTRARVQTAVLMTIASGAFAVQN